MATKKRRAKKKPASSVLVDKQLLSVKTVPAAIITSEKVAEKLLNKKLTVKQKQSIKYKAAIKNYQKAVTRFKLAETLLLKHTAILSKMVKKHSDI